ncbi:hypothetical protein BOTCAL_0833g00030 [Botryotinia calthae]|uniref:Uncharacterized protein n=1 Tax=Botryotinia calthae TaxID=38488 RepID=A0A4Y8CHQ5_9HELO|nr:hypothetical protein BOTCAL_0833g00030 [Botryotinia calthae]
MHQPLRLQHGRTKQNHIRTSPKHVLGLLKYTFHFVVVAHVGCYHEDFGFGVDGADLECRFLECLDAASEYDYAERGCAGPDTGCGGTDSAAGAGDELPGDGVSELGWEEMESCDVM